MRGNDKGAEKGSRSPKRTEDPSHPLAGSMTASRDLPGFDEGRIVEWDEARGYGRISCQSGKVFVHRRDFKERPRAPRKRDPVRFIHGFDDKGRPCAREVVLLNAGVRLRFWHLLFLAALLILPVKALLASPVGPQFWGPFLPLISAVTFGLYARDKQRAGWGARRVPEKRLHLLELLGGWPGAFLAQKKLRHKCSKASYQWVFWLIVLGHQYLALDFLEKGGLSARIMAALRALF